MVFYVATLGAAEQEASAGARDASDAALVASAPARRGVTTGLVAILVALFQVEGIVRSDDQGSMSLLAHASQLQLIPSWAGEPVCLWPGMRTVTKASLPVMLSCSLPVMLVAVYLVHSQLAMSGRLARCTVGGMAPSRSRYKRAFVSLMVFAYGALASAATKLVTPLEVEGHGTRQALTGDEWAREWYIWAGAAWLSASTLWAPLFFAWGMGHQRARTMSMEEFAWGVVLPIPVAAWRGVRHAVFGHEVWRSAELRKGAWTTFTLLSAPYREGRWWWDAVMMGRRLAFVLPSLVLSKTPVGRGFAYVVLSVSFLALHDRQLPFQDPLLNRVETASLSALTLLCASNLLSADHQSHGLAADLALSVVHQSTTWLLWAVVAASAYVIMHRRKDRCFGVTLRRWLSCEVLPLRRWARKWTTRSVSIELDAGLQPGRRAFSPAEPLDQAGIADPLLKPATYFDEAQGEESGGLARPDSDSAVDRVGGEYRGEG